MKSNVTSSAGTQVLAKKHMQASLDKLAGNLGEGRSRSASQSRNVYRVWGDFKKCLRLLWPNTSLLARGVSNTSLLAIVAIRHVCQRTLQAICTQNDHLLGC